MEIAKNDKGKAKLSLVPVQIIRDIALVRENVQKNTMTRIIGGRLNYSGILTLSTATDLPFLRIITRKTLRAVSSITNTWLAIWRLSVI